MIAILTSFGFTAIKFVFFLFLAFCGIVCGKKYRDYKDMKAAGTLTEKIK